MPVPPFLMSLATLAVKAAIGQPKTVVREVPAPRRVVEAEEMPELFKTLEGSIQPRQGVSDADNLPALQGRQVIVVQGKVKDEKTGRPVFKAVVATAGVVCVLLLGVKVLDPDLPDLKEALQGVVPHAVIREEINTSSIYVGAHKIGKTTVAVSEIEARARREIKLKIAGLGVPSTTVEKELTAPATIDMTVDFAALAEGDVTRKRLTHDPDGQINTVELLFALPEPETGKVDIDMTRLRLVDNDKDLGARLLGMHDIDSGQLIQDMQASAQFAAALPTQAYVTRRALALYGAIDQLRGPITLALQSVGAKNVIISAYWKSQGPQTAVSKDPADTQQVTSESAQPIPSTSQEASPTPTPEPEPEIQGEPVQPAKPSGPSGKTSPDPITVKPVSQDE